MILALVDRVELPVFDVHIAQAGQQQLEFFRVEDEYAPLRDDLGEALHKARHLLLDALHESPLYDQIDEFFLVIIRYFNVLAAWLKLMLLFLQVY